MPIPVAELITELEDILDKRRGMGLATVWGWLVRLSDPPSITRAQWWADEVMYQGVEDTYCVEAQDQLEAFAKALKMQEEKNAEGHIQVQP